MDFRSHVGVKKIDFFDPCWVWSPKTAPRGPKTAPRGAQEALRRLQERSKRPHDGSKRAPRGFQTSPRPLQEAPRRLQERSKRPRDASGDPKSAPEGLTTAPEVSRQLQESSRCMYPLQERLQETWRSFPLQTSPYLRGQPPPGPWTKLPGPSFDLISHHIF